MGNGTTFTMIGLAAAGLLTVGVFMIPKNETANAESASGLDKAAVETIVKDWVMANPETIMESVSNFQRAQAEERQNASRENVKKYAGEFGKNDPFIGPEDASVTVVEFFDYNCGYCKRALPTVNQLVDADKDVKVVFVELPILSPQSRTAAQAALAVYKLDESKYFDIHSKLMEFRGQKTEANIQKIVEEMGMDWAKVKEKMASAEVTAMLDNNAKIARDIGVNGTPSFIVGEQFFPGAVNVDALKAAVAKERG